MGKRAEDEGDEMGTDLEAGAAWEALQTVEKARKTLVEAALVPAWFWWMVAVLVIGIGTAADTRRPGIIVGVTVPSALAMAAVTAWLIAGRGRAKVSKDLLGPPFVLGLMGFIWVLVGVSLGLAFGLQAAGLSHPGLAGTGLCALGLVAGGPIFMTRLGQSMLARPGRL